MSQHVFRVDLDLNNNALLNVILENRTAAPTSPITGRMYFDTTLNVARFYDGTNWVSGGSGGGLYGTTTAAVDIDNSDTANPTINIFTANGTRNGLMTIADYNTLQEATDANTASKLVKRDGTGGISVSKATIANSPTAATDATNKGYVDALLGAGMSIVGSIDCSASPQYPSATKGQAYYVSVGGKVGGASGESVSVGDFVLATEANAGGSEALVGDKWIVLNSNIEQATDNTYGTVRLSTASEISSATGDGVVTATQANTLMKNRGFTATLSAGSSSYTITHNLSAQVLVQVISNGGQQVTMNVVRTTSNVITVGANSPLLNDHTIIIQAVGDTVPAV